MTVCHSLLLRTVKFHGDYSNRSWFHSFIVKLCAGCESVCETVRIGAVYKHVSLGFGAASDGMQYLYTSGKLRICHCVFIVRVRCKRQITLR